MYQIGFSSEIYVWQIYIKISVKYHFLILNDHLNLKIHKDYLLAIKQLLKLNNVIEYFFYSNMYAFLRDKKYIYYKILENLQMRQN